MKIAVCGMLVKYCKEMTHQICFGRFLAFQKCFCHTILIKGFNIREEMKCFETNETKIKNFNINTK